MTLEKFFNILTDMELVEMIKDAREVNDRKTLNVALIELGNRDKERKENDSQKKRKT